MSPQQNGSARQAVAQLVAELGRAKRALEAGALHEARDALAGARALDPGNLQAAALEDQLNRRAARPRGGAAPAGRPSSMPATVMQQTAWLSFERKVRDRRAARCVEKADAALAAGAAGDAASAIDELAQLVPDHPRLPELRTQAENPAWSPSSEIMPVVDVASPDVDRLDDGPLGELPIGMAPSLVDQAEPAAVPHPTPAARSTSGRRGFTLLVAVLLFIGAGFALGSWWWLGNIESRRAGDLSARHAQGNRGGPIAADANAPQAMPSQTAPPAPPSESEPSVPPAGTANVPLSFGESSETVAARAPDAGGAGAADGTPSAARGTTPSSQQSGPVQEASQRASNAIATEASESGSPPSSANVPAPAPLADIVVPVGTIGAGGTRTPATSLAPSEAITPLGNGLPAPAREDVDVRDTGPAAGASARTATRPSASAAVDVKQVLDRYALGYSSRQAEVVRQIWPSVDARALERAFGQLQSQEVSFESCSIDAAEATATATCSGTARWIPAVGDRSPRQQSRTWRFDLARGAQGWIITQARVEE